MHTKTISFYSTKSKEVVQCTSWALLLWLVEDWFCPDPNITDVTHTSFSSFAIQPLYDVRINVLSDCLFCIFTGLPLPSTEQTENHKIFFCLFVECLDFDIDVHPIGC